MTSSELQERAAEEALSVQPDFWRCQKCGRLSTALEMHRALGIDGSGSPCPCGSLKFSPSSLPLRGWFLPRVWPFIILRLRGLA